ncbi:MAG: NADP(H)-dependent aldo-keto reductase, partial [Mixta calida]|nr:NADP(H)-dependent aldo-keto reductase [Mixta calida]
MHYHRIPHSTLEVSQLGLGTMTFGEQNSEADAHAQLDLAVSCGINLIDTAEMYPVPPRPETQGLTEQYIGSWLKARGNRDKIVLASKVAGPSRGNDAGIRPGQVLDRKNIRVALEASLKRLNTDYIDLYQVHWPQRQTNCFGKLGYQYTDSSVPVTLLETLEALAEQVRAGKIRYVGVSNETPWGVMRYLQLAEKHELPRIVSIQNPYSLLNRSFEVGLAEISQHEGVELLAYSSLAFGTLSGKYLNGARPAGARNT